ncbi:sesquipedalian [Anaeramoeba flamelloides]|uniref:Sesquipedalian n=1 Tax=Anaeramoeba flamelloides TaxID=1746091 RepID=A0ABQ8YYI6_9EUKA|nr:sesquipedalian [Anaeramoeba flamelloides]
MTTKEKTQICVVFEGFLLKQNSKKTKLLKKRNKSWKKRYFKLTTSQLHYSKSNGSKILGSLNLQEYRCFQKEGITDRFVLRLFKPKHKSLFLEFESTEQMKQWNKRIQKAISDCNEEISIKKDKIQRLNDMHFVKYGWLLKKGCKGIFKSKWKKRFFILKRNDQTLYYLKSEQFQGKATGSIDLKNIMSITETTFNDEPYGLKIALYSSKRVYQIAANSQSELESWKITLQQFSPNAYM